MQLPHSRAEPERLPEVQEVELLDLLRLDDGGVDLVGEPVGAVVDGGAEEDLVDVLGGGVVGEVAEVEAEGLARAQDAGRARHPLPLERARAQLFGEASDYGVDGGQQRVAVLGRQSGLHLWDELGMS